MDSTRWRIIEATYHAALAEAPDARNEFLDRACGGDQSLRVVIESLLAHASQSALLSRPAIEIIGAFDGDVAGTGGEMTLTSPMIGGAGSLTSVASYRVVRRIGHGGMGVVYEAEQQNPQRLVALKVIRGGPVVDELHVRLFEREVDALARLKHPGIAAIYESGQTSDGQHYFAMELVKGQVLDEYARTELSGRPLKRGDRDRVLELFLKICDAIAYAHQRAIIHRDLKPNNIIVQSSDDSAQSSEDGVPDIKVLDFGLARISDETAMGGTKLTQAGDIRGTLAYMSPEQVRGLPDDIDLRTDVYSLGVILYELISGRRPYDIDNVSLIEAARIISERDPAPLQSSSVDRDLRAILWKALEKEPSRRYETVPALADDLRRYLNDLPVHARPASAAVYLRKFVRRHTAAVAAATAVVVILVTGAVAMTFQARRLAIERDRANREAAASRQIAEFLIGLFNVSDPSEARGNTITAREILDRGAASTSSRLSSQPLVSAQFQTVMGRVYSALGLFDSALPLLQTALSIRQEVLGNRHADVAEGHDLLGRVLRDKGNYSSAEMHIREALAIRRELFGPSDALVAEALNDLGTVEFEKSDLSTAEQLFRDALAIRRQTLGEGDERTADSMNDLAITLENRSADYRSAIQLLSEVLRLRRAHWQSDHPVVAQSLNNLAMAYYRNRQFAEAEPLFREALGMNRRLLGELHPDYATNLNNLALLLRDQGRLQEAEALFRQALDIQRRTRGPEHEAVVDALVSLGAVKTRQGDVAAAASLFREALTIQRKTLTSDDFRVATTQGLLGAAVAASGRFADAETLLVPAFRVISKRFGVAHPRSQAMLKRVVDLYHAWGKPARAKEYETLMGTSK